MGVLDKFFHELAMSQFAAQHTEHRLGYLHVTYYSDMMCVWFCDRFANRASHVPEAQDWTAAMHREFDASHDCPESCQEAP